MSVPLWISPVRPVAGLDPDAADRTVLSRAEAHGVRFRFNLGF